MRVVTTLAAAPGTTSADIRLPDRHGGEPMIEYQGKGKSWTAEITGAARTRTIPWVSVVGKAVCRKPGTTWRGGWSYLIDRKVKFDKCQACDAQHLLDLGTYAGTTSQGVPL